MVGRFVQQIDVYWSHLVNKNGSTCSFSSLGESGPKIPMDVITSFWRELLSSSVTSLVQCADQPSLRAAACDCLAIIGVNVFEKLTVSFYSSP